jgi:hypothetical protein
MQYSISPKLYLPTYFDLYTLKSAAGFCHQVAACFPDMFNNFYVVKNHKIAKNPITAKAREKRTHLESLKFLKYFDACLTKFKNNQILHNKFIHRRLLTLKLLTG